ncbi:hypothetical protein BDP27DRAFT_1423056 [Rhodocollybia butyracea]|uniref:Uncharacterized protein n=1 Tax=Rhodocollybia butyracea TaxID=206335 RepID=A0A9P5PS91_9AGAR|nr:hypothetical protein BDP27DRAFT_1423056 [Rhodocollybia butyracea]
MPTHEALMITQSNIPKHELLNSLFCKLMEFSPDELTAPLDLEKYRKVQNKPSKMYKHPFKVNPSWGLTPELCCLDKIPLINTGSGSYAASNLIHANRPSNIGNEPEGQEMACPSCKSCKPKDSPDCDFARDENSKCCYGFRCNVCKKVHLFCPDNLELGNSVGTPNSLQHIIRAMVGLCSTFDQAAAIVEQQKKLLTLIVTSLDQEIQQFCEIGKAPLVFMETVVPTLPDKFIGLNEWAFFASLMNWDSALSFNTKEKYQHFLNSIICINSVPKSPVCAKPTRSKTSSSKVPAPAPSNNSSVASLFNNVPLSTTMPVPIPSSTGVDKEMVDQLEVEGEGQALETVEATKVADTTVP